MGTDQQADFEQWLSQLFAGMEKPVNLEDVLGGSNPFDTLDLLSKVAALQLLPENADSLLRLEAVSAYAATKPVVTNGPLMGKKRLLDILNSEAIDAGPIGLNEDPCDNLNTESLACHGGSYIVFPGIVEGGTYVLRNLSKALFLHPEPFSNRDFTDKAERTFRALLALSDSVASKAGISHNQEINRSEDGIRIPPGPELTRLARAVTFRLDELVEFLDDRGLTIADIEPLFTVAGTLESDQYSVGNSALHLRPIVQVEDSVVVAEPGILTATLRHAILTLANEYGVDPTIGLKLSGRHMGHRQAEPDASGAI